MKIYCQKLTAIMVTVLPGAARQRASPQTSLCRRPFPVPLPSGPALGTPRSHGRCSTSSRAVPRPQLCAQRLVEPSQVGEGLCTCPQVSHCILQGLGRPLCDQTHRPRVLAEWLGLLPLVRRSSPSSQGFRTQPPPQPCGVLQKLQHVQVGHGKRGHHSGVCCESE